LTSSALFAAISAKSVSGNSPWEEEGGGISTEAEQIRSKLIGRF